MSSVNIVRKVASKVALRILGTVSGAEFITKSGRARTVATMMEQCEEKISQIQALTHTSTIQVNEIPTTTPMATSIETALNQRIEEFYTAVGSFEKLCQDMEEVPRMFRFMTRNSALVELDSILADLRELRLGIENLVMHWSSRVDGEQIN